MNYYFFAGAIVAMLIGIVGVVIPVLPDLPLMLIVALLFHFFVKPFSIWLILVFILITIISVLIDHLSGVLGSKLFGATGKSMLLGFVGMILGLVSFPPFGAVIGLFIGILAGELLLKNDSAKAIKAASGGVLSVIFGILLNLILAISFLIFFIIGVV